ncbi:MAG: zinc transporter ZntB [Proteobacteria bacterium]|nr:zinc transporter ZntB [Pseudomonadota bacterium]
MSHNEGLIFAYVLDGNGGGQAIDWGKLKRWSPERGTLWLHLDYESEKVQKWLSEESGLSPILCEALLAEETRPRILSSNEGLLMILRGVNCNPGADPEDMVSLRMWFEERRVISMRHRRVMAIEDIHEAVESDKGPTGSSDFLVMVSDRIADRMGEVIAEIDDSVDELEDAVLTAESHELRPRLANLRRQTISLRRYIAPQRDVLARLHNEHIPWLKEIEKNHIREIAERTTRFVEDIDSARDRAAITHEELNNRLSEQMNKAMYTLSIVAAIFLPLGLLTGLLGINVGGIPGTESRWAFAIVSFVLVGIAAVLIWIFKRIKWL